MKKIIIIVLTLCFITLAPTAHAVYEASGTSSTESYVPNEVIVKYKSGQNPLTLKAQSDDFTTTSDVRNSALQDYSAIKQYNQSLGITNTDTAAIVQEDTLIYKTNGSLAVEAIVSDYNSNPNVEYAEPNYLYYPLAQPNDQYFGQMWGLAKINMPTAWDKTTGSRSVIVADIDSGIDGSHEDLAANIIEKRSFCGGSGQDSGSHGTHTAGTIGAIGNNSKGVVGVNWQVGIMALQVFCSSGGGSMGAISQAIDYATSHGAKVINMSLGGPSGGQTLSGSISRAVSAGVTVVVAAGNCGTSPSRSGCGNPPRTISADNISPANDPKAITVGSTTISDQLSPFSSTGSSVDVSAPGSDIASTVPGSKYQSMSGTSMATPHVTGLVALMYALKPGITPSEVKSILESTAVDLGTPGRDNQFGAGRINAKAALDAVGGGGGGNPNPTPIPTTFKREATQVPRQTPVTGVTRTPPIDCDPSSVNEPCQTPTPPDNGCLPGDINCDGAIDRSDLEKWLQDFLSGRSTLSKFEEWRRAMFRSR